MLSSPLNPNLMRGFGCRLGIFVSADSGFGMAPGFVSRFGAEGLGFRGNCIYGTLQQIATLFGAWGLNPKP